MKKPEKQMINADEWATPIDDPLDEVPDMEFLPARVVKTPEPKTSA